MDKSTEFKSGLHKNIKVIHTRSLISLEMKDCNSYTRRLNFKTESFKSIIRDLLEVDPFFLDDIKLESGLEKRLQEIEGRLTPVKTMGGSQTSVQG